MSAEQPIIRAQFFQELVALCDKYKVAIDADNKDFYPTFSMAVNRKAVCKLVINKDEAYYEFGPATTYDIPPRTRHHVRKKENTTDAPE